MNKPQISLEIKKKPTRENINALARLAGSVKLTENVNIQEIMHEIRYK